jgi:hypothetical protein
MRRLTAKVRQWLRQWDLYTADSSICSPYGRFVFREECARIAIVYPVGCMPSVRDLHDWGRGTFSNYLRGVPVLFVFAIA